MFRNICRRQKSLSGFFVVCILLSVGALITSCSSPSTMTQSTTATSDTSPAPIQISAPQLPYGSGVPVSMHMGPEQGIPVTSLQAPLTAPSEKHFTIVAEKGHITLENGVTINTWTYDGVVPGPTIRVTQGDLVFVTLINHLPFSVTIHWHGIDVPNASDGVAGVTQNAVQPGSSYTYRFIAKDAGTYWYHSHQLSYEETTDGLFGLVIVAPRTPTYHNDLDYSVALHDWTIGNQTLTSMNDIVGLINEPALPGQWVRLRIANTANLPHLVTLLGAPFTVVALDGHDINQPQPLTEKPLLIGAAQRYDLRFQMPQSGSVALVMSKDQLHYQSDQAFILGQGPQTLPSSLPAVKPPFFDMTSYGMPVKGELNSQTPVAATYTLNLDSQLGEYMGRTGMVYSFNGKTFLDSNVITVELGQYIKIRLVNNTAEYHPIHIHGPAFAVVAHNGKALTGSPIYLDTINVPPHESYDIIYTATNPGLWMVHCHNLLHAFWGMDTMIVYKGYMTPFNIGTQSGNFPD
jgi:FtsP/CotA-like multicopper oxidase with cupredoxin domain